ATISIYPLSLHDALPILFMPLSNACIDETARTDREAKPEFVYNTTNVGQFPPGKDKVGRIDAISVETGRTVWSWETRVANYSPRSEEHTSELQSRENLVC